ncbi:UNVERIFIED_CONTAM: Pectinesterase inhibitor 11 [Sesamum angustifolium]|uniref:Pectinesterase inhibitor 11 n=1 Tax=Sesamum angustifolium TaxID=2727405 RepID=A0AAW2JEV7_9LAMI
MPKFNIVLLLLLSSHYMLSSTAKSSPDSTPDTTDFITAECRATRYPALCVRCLSTYSSTIQQSQKRLAQAALSVSLSRAQSVASFVSTMARMRGLRPIEYRTIKDCIDNMANTVDQLNQSVQELSRRTRTSTGTNPTMDGNVKVAITTRVTDCAQVTSNALVLVDRFASRHKALLNVVCG